MSWCLPVGEDFLPGVSVDFLRERLVVERGGKARVRLLAALHRKEGWRLDDIVSAVGLPRQTVHDVLWRLVERGLDAVYDAPRCGRPAYLTMKQQEDLRACLLAGPQASGFEDGFWTTRMVLKLVKDRYGVEYRREHMTQVMQKLGFSSQKPRPESPLKASNEEIMRFKKKAKRVVAYWVNRGFTYFCWDEVTFSLKPHTSYGWFPVGSRPTVKLNWTRKKFHCFGVNNGVKEHYRFYDKINWETTLQTIQYLYYKYPNLLILWDDAPWHRKKEVKQYLRKHNIKTLTFPAYTPELNPVEQTWKHSKQKSANTHYPDKNTYRTEIKRILRQKNLTKMYEYLPN